MPRRQGCCCRRCRRLAGWVINTVGALEGSSILSGIIGRFLNRRRDRCGFRWILYTPHGSNITSRSSPPRLILESRTFISDPLRPYGCGKTLAQAHVSSRLVRALHDLGEAEYPVRTDKFRLPPYRIPWTYEEWDRLPPYPPDRFRLIRFSRVAFNGDRSQGLLAVSDSCGRLCSGGGALIAMREQGEWGFRSVLGCVWVY